MARKIDMTIVWLFVVSTAFILMLVLSNGNVLTALLLAFIITTGCYHVIKRIPERTKISRKKRIAYFRYMMQRWAMQESQSALNEIHSILPDLFETNQWLNVQFIQRSPEGRAFDLNDFLEIWHKTHTNDSLVLLITCSLSSEVKRLLPQLTQPPIVCADSNDIIRKLLQLRSFSFQEIINTTKEQHRPIKERTALLFQNVQPFRLIVYVMFFVLMYVATQYTIYLISSILFGMILMICLIVRRRVF